jgi:hypothetical protein
MSQLHAPPCWSHRGCSIALVGHPGAGGAYRVRHASGALLGEVPTLQEARQLIDEQILLLRQRLVSAA